ncbi:dephospho-CoA kinase [Strigomonas culicis]|uniref:Dephospho-CoA kinase n=1 Tax=Strigomonas culicis TaxID=28005 RepID=S9VY69_9TRYP|nr:dephospho-CoA kinase [Strigomonas culicis]|eukprot:EPY28590.1 dephospho-CoA kinase [Strigomonas culicis]
MILIGPTGGIACGKSTVCRLLAEEHGITVIDADLVVRELQLPGTSCMRRIEQQWPQCIRAETGELDRLALGKIIFEDPEARKVLGRIMNGPICYAIVKKILCLWWRTASDAVVILDAPTLFETGALTRFISNSLVVACAAERQVARLHTRNGFSEADARHRIAAQMPLARKRQLAGYVLENDTDDMTVLRRQVAESVVWMRSQSARRLTWMVSAVCAAVTGTAVAAVLLLCK